MEQNSDFSMQEALRLSRTPAGQQLLALLRQQGGAELQTVIGLASSGDYRAAQQLLSAMLDSPEAKTLLREMGEHHG